MTRIAFMCRAIFLFVLVVMGTTVALVAQGIPIGVEELAKENPRKRDAYFYGVRAYPYAKIPQGARLSAMKQAQASMRAFGEGFKGGAMAQSINQWSCIGPFNVGGRINTVVCHPTDGKTIWVGAADGGVWRSTNRGVSWTTLMDNTNAIAMGALAVDPKNIDVVYAGTGEQHSNSDAYSGAGIMKTTNGGLTWNPSGLTTVGAFSRIIISSLNSNVILAGGCKNNPGLYRSEDGGVTWSRTFDKPVSDISADPSNPDRIVIGTFGHGVYRSTNGGVTLDSANTGLREFGTSLGRVSIQIAPSAPNTVYAVIYESSGTTNTYSRIYRSMNFGVTWTNVYNGDDVSNPNFMGDQGWYNNVMSVKPDNPNVVIAGGQLRMMRTDNGGTNWSSVGTQSQVHVDHHGYAFDPANPNTLYSTNDGGVHRSDDGGFSWTNVNVGLAVTQFYAMGIDQKAANLTYGGTQDNGTLKNTSTQYGEVAGGDGFYVVVDHTNSGVIYGETFNGNLWKKVNGSLSSIMTGITAADAAPWSSPIVMDPVDNMKLFNGRNKVFITVDGGGQWTAASPLFSGLVTAIAVSKVNPDIVYAGSDRGQVMVSKDGGINWTPVADGTGLPNRAVMDFAPSLVDAGTCYVAVAGFFCDHVFKTTNYGVTWTSVSMELPDAPATALAIHLDDPNIIYVGTDIGMFITTDGGQSWATYNSGLPRCAVADLEIHNTSKTLRMASHGRSMWEVALEIPQIPPSITAPTGGEVWIGRTQNVVSWNGFVDGSVSVSYSLDNGVTWKLIASDVIGTSIRWTTPDTSSIVARIRVMGSGTESATSNTFTLTKFSVGSTLRSAAKPIATYGICFDGTHLWSTDFYSKTVLKIDPDNLSTVGQITLNLVGGDSLFTGITWHPGKGHFFVHKLFSSTQTGKGFLYEVGTDGRQINKWTSPCDYPIGLSWTGSDDIPYLIATDRNGSGPNTQAIYLVSPDDGSAIVSLPRVRRVELGPRGAASAKDGQSFYQVITDFTGGSLQSAYVEKMTLDEQQTVLCNIPMNGAGSGGTPNIRGVEFDPRDKNIWVCDLGGTIYKVATCDGSPKDSIPGGVLSPDLLRGISLRQNVPNPTSGATAITFTVPRPVRASIILYTVTGAEVAVVGTGSYEAGQHSMSFTSHGLPSGVYRYVLHIDGVAALSQMMTIMK